MMRIVAGGLDPDAIERQLDYWSRTLREVAPAFLNGDLSAIDDGAAVVRRRVEDHPQAATVYLPEGASREAMDASVADLGDQVPSEVQVKGRWYRRRRR